LVQGPIAESWAPASRPPERIDLLFEESPGDSEPVRYFLRPQAQRHPIFARRRFASRGEKSFRRGQQLDRYSVG
jgi:hypothetical protein